MFSFGICRDAYAKVYIKAHPVRDGSLPGPGTYEVRETPGKDALKYSLRPRTSNPSKCLNSLKLIAELTYKGQPGPGTYEVLPGISPRGNQFYSKYESSRAAQFNPPHSQRFMDLRTTFPYNPIAKGVRLSPGPGHYPAVQAITKNGVYVLSRFSSSRCRTFGVEFRDTLATRGSFMSTPGPGTYRAQSEFGQYQAQEKIVKEIEKVELRRLANDRAKTRGSRNIRYPGGTLTTMASTGFRTNSAPEGRRNKSVIVESDSQLPRKA